MAVGVVTATVVVVVVVELRVEYVEAGFDIIDSVAYYVILSLPVEVCPAWLPSRIPPSTEEAHPRVSYFQRARRSQSPALKLSYRQISPPCLSPRTIRRYELVTVTALFTYCSP